MVKSITILNYAYKKILDLSSRQGFKVVIDCAEIISKNATSFDIEIEFYLPIIQFRNHDYTWVDIKQDRIANEYCPKILKLENGFFVQSNISQGFWEINKKEKNKLLWRFNPQDSSPITSYRGKNNQKIIIDSIQKFNFKENPCLLFSNANAIEFSRSKIPFSAIAVFTDHCDFDTPENLRLQREFFKQNNIKTTKGFFLNHFSKREDNASFQKDSDELTNWKNDGHELCYHSLSQSIKSDYESFDDFYNFKPPFPNIATWIDHGYQPYNFSLFQNNAISENDFEQNLNKKNITILWNYIDSGTATINVINQLNTKHFTLSNFLKGNSDLSFIKKMQLMIKNIIFHYYGEEDFILKYKSTATNFKKITSQKKLSYLFPLIKDLFLISNKILSVFLSWDKTKKIPYKLAKYSPILFKHKVFEKEFYIFQTLEMLDFKKALSTENINNFINEKGVFIAHTYFSVPMTYHQGRMFLNETSIDETVANNFKYLGKKIEDKEIWNPTLHELIEYWSKFEQLTLDVDHQGNIVVKNETELIYRNAT